MNDKQRIRETIFESKIERASDDVERKRSLQDRERGRERERERERERMNKDQRLCSI